MKVLVVSLALFVALATANPTLSQLKQQFADFKTQYGKVYTSDEEPQRFATFVQNVKEIEEHNSKGLKWTMGINKFADLTKEEFKAKHLNGYVNMYKTQTPKSSPKDIDVTQMPTAKDWRDDGVITPVKDQGGCGSCWAFTTAEIIESYVAINTGSTKNISTQQITSCALNGLRCGGTGGCAGSVVELGLTYAQLFQITTEDQYPYLSGLTGDTADCLYDPDAMTGAAQVMGYELLERNNYDVIMNHLAYNGPLAVAVDASVWGLYNGGVFNSCDFDKNIQINHAVQLVGYGTDPVDGDYWLIRNSWSDSWGENGYIKLERNATPKCGTDSTPLAGVGCVNDGNTVQNVCGQCGVLYDVVYPIGAFAP